MAYLPKSSNRFNTFGSFPSDPNHKDLSGGFNYFMTQDGSPTAKNSPLAVATGTVTAITIPQGAVNMQIISSVALRFSDEPTAAAHYFVIPAGVVFEIPCMSPGMDSGNSGGLLYLMGDSAAATVQFMFSCL